MPARHILDKHRVEHAAQIVGNRLGIVESRRKGHAAIGEVTVERILGTFLPAPRRSVLRKRERQHIQLDIAAREQRGKLSGKEEGIRARDVQVDALADIERIDGPLELPYVLHLVEEHVVRAGTQALDDIAVELARVERVLFVPALEVDTQDVAVCDALCAKLPTKQFEHTRLAATAQTSCHLDDVAILPPVKPAEINRTIYQVVFHICSKPMR